MSDVQQLELLKEVAGTTVYEEKKSESLVKISENEADNEKIREILPYIDERLTELEGEKEELNAYQKVDRARCTVEYTLYDKKLWWEREAIDDIEHLRSEAKKLSQLYEDARSIHDLIWLVETQIK